MRFGPQSAARVNLSARSSEVRFSGQNVQGIQVVEFLGEPRTWSYKLRVQEGKQASNRGAVWDATLVARCDSHLSVAAISASQEDVLCSGVSSAAHEPGGWSRWVPTLSSEIVNKKPMCKRPPNFKVILKITTSRAHGHRTGRLRVSHQTPCRSRQEAKRKR